MELRLTGSNRNFSDSTDFLHTNELNGLQHAPKLTQSALIRVYVLGILGIISLIGNVAIIFHLFKTRQFRRCSGKTWSTIYVLILHLSIADLFVTVFCIFGEAAWYYTVEWIAGELACKLVKFCQMFALYLSTYVLVLIGIDRWTAVRYPMQSLHMSKRCYRYLAAVYTLSMVLSSPQYYIFTVTQGPFVEPFYQCVTYGAYTADWQEKLYAMFTLIFMFIIPLGILIYTYVSTIKAISESEKSFQSSSIHNDYDRNLRNRQKLLNRAKIKSFRISVAIVAAFIICWTPYYASMFIFMFMNPDQHFGEDLMSAIFFFGMTNSVVNPLIYGAFSLWPLCKRRKKTNSIRNNNNNNSKHGSFVRDGCQLQNTMQMSLTTLIDTKNEPKLPLRTEEITALACQHTSLVRSNHSTTL